MKKILFFTRNDPNQHVIVRNILAGFRRKMVVDIINFKNFTDLLIRHKTRNFNIVYHDDPIAVFIYYLFGAPAFRIFHSLEMYEYQVQVNSLKRIFRYFIFKFLHRFSLARCDLIIFPSELRREYYLNKYVWLRGRNTRVMENIPMNIKSNIDSSFDELILASEFVSRYERTLVVAGAIGEGRDVADIIKEFSVQNRYGLCIITQSEVSISSVDSVLLLKNLPHQKVLGLYRLFDAGLLYYENSPLNVKYCAPTKMYEYLSNGLYLIGNNNFSLRSSPFIDFYFDSPSDIIRVMDKISSMPPKGVVEFDFFRSFDEVFAFSD